jgi:hypothetical protein
MSRDFVAEDPYVDVQTQQRSIRPKSVQLLRDGVTPRGVAGSLNATQPTSLASGMRGPTEAIPTVLSSWSGYRRIHDRMTLRSILLKSNHGFAGSSDFARIIWKDVLLEAHG